MSILNKGKPKKVEVSNVNRMIVVNSQESLMTPRDEAKNKVQIIRLQNYKTLSPEDIQCAIRNYISKKDSPKYY
jgi:hypothetical protein